MRHRLPLIAAIALPAAALAQAPARLAGVYDGGQTDVAAGLELRADRRFRYLLGYGALDEQAEGTWRVAGGRVLLTSGPVIPPRFVLTDRRAAPAGRLRVSLAVPAGLSRQYFKLEVRRADGSTSEQQFGDETDWLDLEPGQGPVAVALTLPVFDLRSDPVDVPDAGGLALGFRFEPHDLGRVAFADTPLVPDHGTLVLVRHDLTLRFRRARS